jgi:hypothetical protein
MQVAVNKGLSHGFTTETTYTWSRALGEADDDLVKVFVDPLNRSRDKSLLSFHRTHDLRSNGMLELPIGPGHRLLGTSSPILSRVVQDWQLGSCSISARARPNDQAGRSEDSTSMFGAAGNYPDRVADLPKSSGR